MCDDHLLHGVSRRSPRLQGGRNATLQSVCYKPFGDECATQSVLQYWQMNRTLYTSGVPPYHLKMTPEFCFNHWSTQVCITALIPRPNP